MNVNNTVTMVVGLVVGVLLVAGLMVPVIASVSSDEGGSGGSEEEVLREYGENTGYDQSFSYEYMVPDRGSGTLLRVTHNLDSTYTLNRSGGYSVTVPDSEDYVFFMSNLYCLATFGGDQIADGESYVLSVRMQTGMFEVSREPYPSGSAVIMYSGSVFDMDWAIVPSTDGVYRYFPQGTSVTEDFGSVFGIGADNSEIVAESTGWTQGALERTFSEVSFTKGADTVGASGFMAQIKYISVEGNTMYNEDYLSRLSKVSSPSVSWQFSCGENMSDAKMTLNGTETSLEDLFVDGSLNLYLFATPDCYIVLWGEYFGSYEYGLFACANTGSEVIIQSITPENGTTLQISSSSSSISIVSGSDIDCSIPNTSVNYIYDADGDYVVMAIYNPPESGPFVYTLSTPEILMGRNVAVNTWDSNGPVTMNVVVTNDILMTAEYSEDGSGFDSYDYAIVPYRVSTIDDGSGGGSGLSPTLKTVLSVIPLVTVVGIVLGTVGYLRMKN